MESVYMRESLINISPVVSRKDCFMLMRYYCKRFNECKTKFYYSFALAVL